VSHVSVLAPPRPNREPLDSGSHWPWWLRRGYRARSVQGRAGQSWALCSSRWIEFLAPSDASRSPRSPGQRSLPFSSPRSSARAWTSRPGGSAKRGGKRSAQPQAGPHCSCSPPWWRGMRALERTIRSVGSIPCRHPPRPKRTRYARRGRLHSRIGWATLVAAPAEYCSIPRREMVSMTVHGGRTLGLWATWMISSLSRNPMPSPKKSPRTKRSFQTWTGCRDLRSGRAL